MSSFPFNLKELKDGLLVSDPEAVIMKAREPALFPELVRECFSDKTKIQYKKIDFGLERVTVKSMGHKAVFNSEYVNYLKDLGRIEYYLSNIPLPGEIPTYPLFAKYKYGWVVVSPLEAV
jgi:hypothetical protein